MIIVRLAGGLGNQLFQYAFARVLAIRQNTSVSLDTSFYTGKVKRLRKFELHNFALPVQKIISSYDTTDTQDNSTSSGKVIHQGQSFTVLDDTYEGIDEAARYGPNLLLRGEWSARTEYLHEPEVVKMLRSELIPRNDLGPAFQTMASKISKASSSVSMQVRRGDYLKLRELFQTLGLDYYRSAMDVVRSQISDPTFFIFSDDPTFVAEEFKSLSDCVHIGPFSPVQSLELARRCDHVICANSTFSWWSAYLGQEEDGIVVFPKNYYVQASDQCWHENELSDYVRPDWQLV